MPSRFPHAPAWRPRGAADLGAAPVPSIPAVMRAGALPCLKARRHGGAGKAMAETGARASAPAEIGEAAITPDELAICWRPTPAHVENSNLKRFMDRHGLLTFDELLRWSVADVARFWDAVARDLELEWYEPYTQ